MIDSARQRVRTEMERRLHVLDDPDQRCGTQPHDHDRLSDDQVANALAHLDENTEALPRWPWPRLHEAVGPLRGGTVWVLGAVQGNGKTAVGLNLVEALTAQRTPWLYVGLEVDAKVLRAWWACLKTGIPRYRLNDNSLSEDERKGLRDEIVAQREHSKLAHFANGYTMSPEYVIGLATRLWRTRRVKVVILDHLQHLDYNTPYLRQAVGDAMKSIKACALEHDLVFVVASQLTRRSRDSLQAFRVPAISELKESGSIEQIADVVLFAHRGLKPDSMAEQKKFRQEGGDISDFAVCDRLYLHVAKHRFGLRTGHSIPLQIHTPSDRIVEVEPANPASSPSTQLDFIKTTKEST